MSRAWLLVPAALAWWALSRGWIVAKMGVPISCALILAWVRRREFLGRRDLLALAAALAFSAAGDWFLSHRSGRESYFLTGIGLFFVAHLGYLGFAASHGRWNRVALGLLLVVFLPYYAFWLRPAIRSPALSGAVLAYLLISCVVLARAAGLRLPRPAKLAYVAGIALIVYSDTLISFNEFLRYRKYNWLILPTYYLAHLCVTWAAWSVPAPAPASAPAARGKEPRPRKSGPAK